MTKDSGETVWQILTRDGSGTVTKYSTGETVTAGRVYDLHIFVSQMIQKLQSDSYD